ncbi:hypothetical protein RhiirC2_794622 [Rhizophagus irregularis]|uniref:BTB domain-containing protein n=1 Tax=Rhizophagus irregularis TaxID=588596 RepID=A0A2N1MD77_9GLOM|nr:hypothetical protein RhiirC2_794622 [Rhizophagus irregularis]
MVNIMILRDITIEVSKDPNVKIFRAHTGILCYRSPYLRRYLALNKKNNDNVLAQTKYEITFFKVLFPSELTVEEILATRSEDKLKSRAPNRYLIYRIAFLKELRERYQIYKIY